MKIHKPFNLKPAAFILSLVFLFSQAARPQTAHAAETDARSISIFKVEGGDVKMTKGTPKMFAAKEGYRLNDGYTLSTGLDSFCYIQMDEDSLLKMDERSQVAVSKKSKDKLSVSVQSGSALVDAGEQAEGRVLETRVGNTGLVVRGTVYVIGQKDGGDIVITMLEGTGDVDGNPLPAGASMTVYDDNRIIEKHYDITRELDPLNTDLFTAEAIFEYSDGLIADGHLTEEQAEALPQIIARKTEERRIEKEAIIREEEEEAIREAINYSLPTPRPSPRPIQREELSTPPPVTTPTPAPPPTWVPPPMAYIPPVSETPPSEIPPPADIPPTDTPPTDNPPTETPSTEKPVVVEPAMLSIVSVSQPINTTVSNANFVTPIISGDGLYSERAATFTAEVSGFANGADATNVGLEIGLTDEIANRPITGFEITGHNAVNGSVNGVKVFEMRIEYEGEAMPSLVGINVTGLTGLSAGGLYAFDGNIKSSTFELLSGLDELNPIPVTQENIMAFNDYANTPNGLARYYTQTESISLPVNEPVPSATPESNWTPIGRAAAGSAFTGSYDGLGHRIDGLRVASSDPNAPIGFFGSVGAGGTVRHLGLYDIEVTGMSGVGGIAGDNAGVIDQCFAVNGTINGSGGSAIAGGLAGVSSGEIRNCYTDITVSGDYWAGGIAGAVSNINGSGVISHCYSVGAVRGDFFAGGIVGRNDGYIANNAALNAAITGGNAWGRVIGANPTGTQSNNYGKNDLPLSAGNTDSLDHTSVDGAPVERGDLPLLWSDSAKYSEAWQPHIWDIQATAFPILRSFAPGTQTLIPIPPAPIQP